MRYSQLSAPIACSLALHVVLLNFGWDIYAARASVAVPWQQAAALRVRIARPAARPPAETVPRPKAPPPPDLPKVAALARPDPLPRSSAPPASPALPAAEAVPPAPLAPIAPDAPEQKTDAPTDLPDSAFAEPGGVDEMARPLREPEFSLPDLGIDPRTSAKWVIEFDLLIDAQGKVVRVANVSEGLPRNIVGAVLAAFYVLPFEPAKLAGQPVAIRQRFEVRP